jgi:hypothetical protein
MVYPTSDTYTLYNPYWEFITEDMSKLCSICNRNYSRFVMRGSVNFYLCKTHIEELSDVLSL